MKSVKLAVCLLTLSLLVVGFATPGMAQDKSSAGSLVKPAAAFARMSAE